MTKNVTYGEQRSAAAKIADEELKERVLRGLEVVRERYGDDWVDHIDPLRLDLSSPTRCVLGQLESQHTGGMAGNDPFMFAIAAIDGDVENDPFMFGFDTDEEGEYGYSELTEAWLAVIEG